MTIQEIFEDAYEDTNTSTANYPYTKALQKFNSMYKEIYRMIVTTQEDYFWTYWNTDLQQGAREYKVERLQTSYVDDGGNTVYVPGIAKVKKVIVYNSEGKATELEELSDYEESIGLKGWELKDNHIFLNWTPAETITGGLEIVGIQAINDVALTDDASVIFPGHEDLQDFANVLVRGLKKELWEHKQDFEKADRCEQKCQTEVEKMKRYISQRVQSIYYSKLNK